MICVKISLGGGDSMWLGTVFKINSLQHQEGTYISFSQCMYVYYGRSYILLTIISGAGRFNPEFVHDTRAILSILSEYALVTA